MGIIDHVREAINGHYVKHGVHPNWVSLSTKGYAELLALAPHGSGIQYSVVDGIPVNQDRYLADGLVYTVTGPTAFGGMLTNIVDNHYWIPKPAFTNHVANISTTLAGLVPTEPGARTFIAKAAVSCECGSEKVGSPVHSNWCAKHEESV